MRQQGMLSSQGSLVAKLNLLGESVAFSQLLAHVERFANCDATVLIDGETGTGKEFTARAIHYLSARRDGPFVPINCGALPDALLSSELFGHSRGAFTDAHEARPGLIAQAEGGTLFLDEIETLSPLGQVALLRFLQDYEYRPLGAGRPRAANVRTIAATNASLAELVDRGHFRRDLFYRLSVLLLEVPPLRARGDDALVLARAFIHKLCVRYQVAERGLHPDAIAAVRAYPWPGNIRELENLIHREFLLTDESDLVLAALPRAPGQGSAERHAQARHAAGGIAFREAKAQVIAEFEREYIRDLLCESQGNLTLAARLAGKERSRFNRMVRKYHFNASEFRGRPAGK